MLRLGLWCTDKKQSQQPALASLRPTHRHTLAMQQRDNYTRVHSKRRAPRRRPEQARHAAGQAQWQGTRAGKGQRVSKCISALGCVAAGNTEETA